MLWYVVVVLNFVKKNTVLRVTALLFSCWFEVIRSGDYYMFDDLTEDELDLQTEASEDKFLDDDAKKPGPIQVNLHEVLPYFSLLVKYLQWNVVLTTGKGLKMCCTQILC